MTQALENTKTTPDAGAKPDNLTAARFMDDLAKDYLGAQSELKSDKAAEAQDKQDGNLAHTLLNEVSSGKLHVQNVAQFKEMTNQTLHDAHRDLSLEPQYERDTQKRADADLAVMKSLSHQSGVKLPNLTLTESASDTSKAPSPAIDADLANAKGELTGDIQARTYDQHDINASKSLGNLGQQFLNLPGIQDMFSALQKESRNSQQDIHDEHLYQTDAQVRINLDLLAGGK